MSSVNHVVFIGMCVGPCEHFITKKKQAGAHWTMGNKENTQLVWAFGDTAKRAYIQCLDKSVVAIEGHLEMKNGLTMVIADSVQCIYQNLPEVKNPIEDIKRAYDPEIILAKKEKSK